MPKIPRTFPIGNKDNLTVDYLYFLIQEMYTTLADQVNQKPSVYLRKDDGQPDDVLLSNGDININTTTLKVEMLTEHTTPTTVVWTTLS